MCNVDGLASPSPLDLAPSGVSTPKNVSFDLPSSTDQTPQKREQHFSSFDGESSRSHPNSRDFAYDDRTTDTRSRRDRERNHHRRRSDSLHDYRPDREGRSGRDADKSTRRARGRASSPASVRSDDSGDTVELPPRFDQQGRRRAQPEMGDDAVGMKMEDFLTGKNAAGKMFQDVISGLFSGDHDDDGGRHSGRRR